LPTLAGVAVGVAASVTRPLAAVVAAGTASTLSLLEPAAANVDLALAPLLSLAGWAVVVEVDEVVGWASAALAFSACM